MPDHPKTTSFIRMRLPHWQVADGRYFITVCQKGALPEKAILKIRQIGDELKNLQGTQALERKRMIFKEIESRLDSAANTLDLAKPEIAQAIEQSVEYQKSHGHWRVIDYVIMPSHLHLFIKPIGESLLESLIEFKRWTGMQGNRILSKRGSFWQREWFDHWSRSPEEDEKIVRYIRLNPVRAGLCAWAENWPYCLSSKRRDSDFIEPPRS